MERGWSGPFLPPALVLAEIPFIGLPQTVFLLPFLDKKYIRMRPSLECLLPPEFCMMLLLGGEASATSEYLRAVRPNPRQSTQFARANARAIDSNI